MDWVPYQQRAIRWLIDFDWVTIITTTPPPRHTRSCSFSTTTIIISHVRQLQERVHHFHLLGMEERVIIVPGRHGYYI
jgi:hypothetical protein